MVGDINDIILFSLFITVCLLLTTYICILIIDKCPMLEWQLCNLQSNVNRGVKNRNFGIRYFTIESTGLRISHNSSITENNLKKITLNPPSTFRGLIVFLVKVSETLCNDFSHFYKDQIISIVVQEKIPFILCLNRTDDANSENSIKTEQLALDQIKKITKALRASLEVTHWIICIETPFGKLILLIRTVV